MQGKGLSGSYKFTRGPCIYSTSMVAVEVTLVNNSEAPISNICVGEKVSYLLESSAVIGNLIFLWKFYCILSVIIFFFRN